MMLNTMRKGRTKLEIVNAIFDFLETEEEVLITHFQKISLNNKSAFEYIELINSISQRASQKDLIEIKLLGKSKIIRLTKD